MVGLSAGELFALIGSATITILAWGALMVRGAALDRRLWSTSEGKLRPGGAYGCLATIFGWAAVGAIVAYVILFFAASDVRPSAMYVFLYVLMGFGVTGINTVALRIFGWRISDMFERRNNAAHTLFYTATVASALAFAGANIGDGPGFYVVLFCAGLSHVTLWSIAVAHAALNRTAYRILVDHDRGIAFRFGCMLVAIGAILGRGVAGDWPGYVATTVDFMTIAWPAILYLVVDTMIARFTLTREIDGGLWADRATGVVYVLIAAAYLMLLGMPA